MSAEAVTYSLLSNAAAVTAIVGTRIYPGALPQGVSAPAIVYDLISAMPVGAIDSRESTHVTRSRVQVSLLGSDFAQLRTLRDAVVAALRHQRGAIAGTQVHATFLELEGTPAFEESLGLWHRPVDFLLIHQQ